MEIVVATSLTNDALVTINFSNLISHEKRASPPGRRNDDACFGLQPDWRDNSESLREKEIIPFFKIGNAGWQPSYWQLGEKVQLHSIPVPL